MESYIIRIYKRQKDDPEELLGQVLDIQTDKNLPFKSMEDLMRILCSVKGMSEPEEKDQ